VGSQIDQWKAQGARPQVAQQESEPNWWDTALNKTLSGLGDAVEWVERGTTQRVADYAAEVDNPILTTAVEAVWTPFRAIGAVTPMALDYAAWAESNLFSRPISTVAQASTIDNALYRDGFQFSDFGEMWDASETLTPAQAIINLQAEAGRGLARITGMETEGTMLQGSLLDPSFNIYQQQAALAENNFWNLGTGIGDAAIAVVGGKGVGVVAKGAGRLAGLKAAGLTARELGAVRSQADLHKVTVYGDDPTQGVENWIGRNIEDLTQSTDQIDIRNNPLVRDSIRRDELSNLIRQTDDYDTVKELILADRGDRQAVANLMKSAPDHVWSLADMNLHLAEEVARRGVGVFDPKTDGILRTTFDTALDRDEFYRKTADVFLETGDDGLYTAINVNNATAPLGMSYARSATGQRIAETRPVTAIREGLAATQSRFDKSRALTEAGAPLISRQTSEALAEQAGKALDTDRFRYRVLGKVGQSAPLTILAKWVLPNEGSGLRQFVGGRRSLNMVGISGMRANDAMDEIIAYTGSRPLRGNREVTVYQRGADGAVTPRVMNMDDYRREAADRLGSVIGDDTAVARVVDEIHDEMLSAVAHQRGITDPNVIVAFQEGIARGRSPLVEGLRDGGYFFDANGNRILADPTFRSQLADSTMLTDLDALDRYMRRAGEGVNPAQQGWSTVQDKLMSGFEFGQTAFRTATLFRPAYTLKNSIGEPIFSAYLAHGATQMLDGVATSTKEFLTNRRKNLESAGLRVGDFLGTSEFAKANRRVEALHVQRIEQANILDELDASIEQAESRGPQWLIDNYEPLRDEVNNVRAALDAVERTLDLEDPGWRQVTTSMPTMRDLKRQRKMIERGLADPEGYPKRLRSNALRLRNRAQKAEDEAWRETALANVADEASYTVDRWERQSKGTISSGTDIVATHPTYGEIGRLALKPGKEGGHEVHDINALFPRTGVGTKMWEAAKDAGLDPRHSAQRTDVGDRWARRVGGDLPPRSDWRGPKDSPDYDPDAPTTKAPKVPSTYNPEKVSSWREKADRLEMHAQRWESLTPDQRDQIAMHMDDLGNALTDLSIALDDPARLSKEARERAAANLAETERLLRETTPDVVEGGLRRTALRDRSYTIDRDITITTPEATFQTGGLADPGNYGAAIRDDFSAGRTQYLTFDPNSYVGQRKAKMLRDGQVRDVKPGEKTYYDEYVHSVNRWIRNDPIAKQIVDGATPEDIAMWLLTPEGRKYVIDMGWDVEDVAERELAEGIKITEYMAGKMDDAYGVVNSYLPTQEVRDIARVREVTAADLATIPFDFLPTVSGGALKVMMSNSPQQAVRNGLNQVWQLLATKPEDMFGRFPFAAHEFQRVLQRNVDLAIEQGAVIDTNTLNAMKYAARQQTLQNVEKTFYNINRYNNAVYAARYATVYPAAIVNSFTRYTRLGLREPGNLAVATAMWNNMFMSLGVDDEGNPVTKPSDATAIVFDNVPEAVAKAIGSDSIKFRPQSLQVIGGRASPNWTITVPTQVLTMNNPDRAVTARKIMGEQVFEEAFPFGFPTQDDYSVLGLPVDQFVPSWVKDIRNVVMDTERQQANAIDQYKWDLAQWQKRKDSGMDPGPVPAIEDARDSAFKFMLLTAMTKFVVPGAPSYVVDGSAESRLFNDQFRQILAENNDDYDAATAAMKAKHGEWIMPLLQGESEYLFYAPANVTSYERIQKEGDYLAQVLADNKDTPEVASVLFGDISNGTYDPEVADWMTRAEVNGEPIRGKQSPEEYASALAANESWDTYNKARATLDATMQQYGYSSLRVKDAAWLNAQWKEYMEGFQEDPANAAWLNEFGSGNDTRVQSVINTMATLTSDESFMKGKADTPYWSTMKDYLRNLEIARTAYREQPDKESRDAIQVQWDQYVREELAPKSGDFMNVYNRFLYNAADDIGKDLE
jgi:hypothetical protein